MPVAGNAACFGIKGKPFEAKAGLYFGQSDPAAKFIGPDDGPLVQIPKTGVIWKICKAMGSRGDDDQGDDKN